MSSTLTRKTRLGDYDAYGFDLDYTIAKFHFVNQIKVRNKGSNWNQFTPLSVLFDLNFV